MYQYILFDLDGTLTDPGIGITNSVAHALGKFGIEVSDRTELYKFIGPPLKDSFREFYGFSEENSLLAIDYYRESFKDTGIFENAVYEGIPELLQALKAAGKTLVLATSKPEVFACRILDHFGLSPYFDFAAGASMDGALSTKADVIRYALQKAGVTDRSRAVMVGDRKHDILGAKENGLASVGVLFGYGSRKELETAGADLIAKTPADLLRLL